MSRFSAKKLFLKQFLSKVIAREKKCVQIEFKHLLKLELTLINFTD